MMTGQHEADRPNMYEGRCVSSVAPGWLIGLLASADRVSAMERERTSGADVHRFLGPGDLQAALGTRPQHDDSPVLVVLIECFGVDQDALPGPDATVEVSGNLHAHHATFSSWQP